MAETALIYNQIYVTNCFGTLEGAYGVQLVGFPMLRGTYNKIFKSSPPTGIPWWIILFVRRKLCFVT
jgi:hypothetical protein